MSSCRSRWPCGLRCRSEAISLLGSRIRILLRAYMSIPFVCVLCRYLPLRRADHSFRGILPCGCECVFVVCVCVCDVCVCVWGGVCVVCLFMWCDVCGVWCVCAFCMSMWYLVYVCGMCVVCAWCVCHIVCVCECSMWCVVCGVCVPCVWICSMWCMCVVYVCAWCVVCVCDLETPTMRWHRPELCSCVKIKQAFLHKPHVGQLLDIPSHIV